jgi:ATP-dependent DNA helicase DinG
MRRELGMPDTTVEFTGESPFSYETQVVGYFPTHLPDQTDDDYIDALTDEVVKLINYWSGRTMILFTNAGHMRQVWERASRRVNFACYVQGQMQKQALLTVFQQDTHSCLFATRSFFTGVDIPGEALSCVILVKAPFRVPTEPMFKAKCDLLDKNGINSFAFYSMPLMLFDVRQSFGRLIRTTTDQGMFALLDSRALKKSYGGTIRKTLPPIGEMAVIGEPVALPKKRFSMAALEED